MSLPFNLFNPKPCFFSLHHFPPWISDLGFGNSKIGNKPTTTTSHWTAPRFKVYFFHFPSSQLSPSPPPCVSSFQSPLFFLTLEFPPVPIPHRAPPFYFHPQSFWCFPPPPHNHCPSMSFFVVTLYHTRLPLLPFNKNLCIGMFSPSGFLFPFTSGRPIVTVDLACPHVPFPCSTGPWVFSQLLFPTVLSPHVEPKPVFYPQSLVCLPPPFIQHTRFCFSALSSLNLFHPNSWHPWLYNLFVEIPIIAHFFSFPICPLHKIFLFPFFSSTNKVFYGGVIQH